MSRNNNSLFRTDIFSFFEFIENNFTVLLLAGFIIPKVESIDRTVSLQVSDFEFIDEMGAKMQAGEIPPEEFYAVFS